MKKSIILLAIFALIFASCKKEIIEQTELTQNTSINEKTSSGCTIRYFWIEGDKMGCKFTGCNCSSVDFVITASQTERFNQIISIIIDGDETEILDVLISDREMLTQYIESTYIDQVIEGELLISAKENIYNDTKFIIFYNNNDERDVVMAYPFVR